MTATCSACGTEFVPGNVRAEVCSRECFRVRDAARRREYRARNRKAREVAHGARLDAAVRERVDAILAERLSRLLTNLPRGHGEG